MVLEYYLFLILDPKLKKVSFQYLVNGQRVLEKDLTSTYLEKVFGNTEYSMVGTLDDFVEINTVSNEMIEIETFEVVMEAENDVGSYKEILRMSNCTDVPPVKVLPVMDSEIIDINVVDRCVLEFQFHIEIVNQKN